MGLRLGLEHGERLDVPGYLDAKRRYAAIIPGSVTPLNTVGSSQVFSVVFADLAGNPDLSGMHLLFNSSLNAVGVCWVYYVRSSNTMYLINDAGNGFVA